MFIDHTQSGLVYNFGPVYLFFSVCLYIRLSGDNFRKRLHRKFIFAPAIYLQEIRVRFVYECHRVKVKVTGIKKRVYVSCSSVAWRRLKGFLVTGLKFASVSAFVLMISMRRLMQVLMITWRLSTTERNLQSSSPSSSRFSSSSSSSASRLPTAAGRRSTRLFVHLIMYNFTSVARKLCRNMSAKIELYLTSQVIQIKSHDASLKDMLSGPD